MWMQGLLAYSKDRFTDLGRHEEDQRSSISDGAEAVPLHGRLCNPVAEVFAALAEMQAGKGPGGDQATVDMWQSHPVRLKLQVTSTASW